MDRTNLIRLAFVVPWVVCLVGAEFASRVIAPLGSHRPRFHGFVADSILGYRQKPNHRCRVTFHTTFSVRTNSLGIRDRDYGARRPGVPRVLLLGDSQTFGLVDEPQTLARQLERELSRAGRKWEVINAGINGYGTAQELEWLRRLIPVYRPDLVVLTLYPNDVFDNRYRPTDQWRVDARGDLHTLLDPAPAQPPATRLRAIRDSIGRFSNLFLLASNAAGRLVQVFRPAPPPTNPPPPEFARRLLAREWDADQKRDWARTDSLLGEIARAARSAAVRLLLVDGGTRAAVSWAMWPANSDTARYHLDLQTELIDSVAARIQVPCVHVLPAFRAAPDPRALYLDTDDHWSPAGYLVAARTLVPAVREQIARGH